MLVLMLLSCNLHDNQICRLWLHVLGWLQDLVLSATALPVRRILTVGYLFLSVVILLMPFGYLFLSVVTLFMPFGSLFLTFGYLFLRNKYLINLYFLCWVQREEDPVGVLIMGIFCVRIPGSDLGSCHSPPRMEQ